MTEYDIDPRAVAVRAAAKGELSSDESFAVIRHWMSGMTAREAEWLARAVQSGAIYARHYGPPDGAEREDEVWDI